MVQRYFKEILMKCTEDDFLDGVRKAYHYPIGERETLRALAGAMQKTMLEEAVWNHEVLQRQGQNYAQVAMTLGEGVDILQDGYMAKGLLTESYMIEVLGSEILLHGYEAYNRWVDGHTDYHVERYYFLNDGEQANKEVSLSLKGLPKLLATLGLPVTCNVAYCMTPRKSVAFYATFTKEENVVCPGICTDCKSVNCPNRISHELQKGWNFADMIDRPLPYGYARIFGRGNV
ncbi:MAG: hypothetical protein IJ833_03500 [Lachnospiraceae bacterium]|nr:hypothetical protein [Lachnospiraceae bacterium]